MKDNQTMQKKLLIELFKNHKFSLDPTLKENASSYLLDKLGLNCNQHFFQASKKSSFVAGPLKK